MTNKERNKIVAKLREALDLLGDHTRAETVLHGTNLYLSLASLVPKIAKLGFDEDVDDITGKILMVFEGYKTSCEERQEIRKRVEAHFDNGGE